MAFITETIAFDRRLQLGNEEFYRPVQMGGNWTKARIGIRFAINGWADMTGSNAAPFLTLDKSFLQLGWGTDANSYFLNDRPTQFLGARIGGSGDNNASPKFNAVQEGTSYYSITSGDFTTIIKNNSGLTQGSRAGMVTGGAVLMAANSPLTTEHELMMTWQRTGSNYVLVDIICPVTAANVQAGKTATQFINDMDNENGTVVAYTNVGRSANNFPYFNLQQDFNFPLNYVSVYWSKATPTIEISHIAVTRFF